MYYISIPFPHLLFIVQMESFQNADLFMSLSC